MRSVANRNERNGTMTGVLSAIVLTHNSSDTLLRTLDSLTWCDEVLVVDDESTDATVTLAKKAGAIVYVHKSDDDFAAQRNFGLAKAKGEWVLFVDSDEVVTPQLAAEIQSVGGSSGYYIRRLDYLFGRWLNHGETSRVRLLRLARKGAGKWIRSVHEIWNVEGETGQLSHPLLHYPHPNVAQFLDSINRYSTLNARYLHARGIHASWWQIGAYPKAKFFVNYLWYLGFLDGTAGAVVAIMMSFHSFLTRAKLYLLWHRS